MGRTKPVPQPLTLALSDDTVSGAAVAAAAAGGGATAGETVPNSDAASPRSPRSPFRFGQKKSDNPGDTVQLADVLHQPADPTPPRPRTAATIATSIVRQRDQKIIQQEKRSPVESTTQYSKPPPLPSPRDRTVDQRARQPNQPPPQLGHRNPRHDDDKTSKSSFFFNFGKSAKPTDRPTTHHHTGSRTDIMSRDSDHPKKTSKQTSTKQSEPPQQQQDLLAQRPVQQSKSEVSLASSVDYDTGSSVSGSNSRRHKPKPFNLLSRTKSTKDKDERENKDGPSPRDRIPLPIRAPESEKAYASAPLKTAPLHAHDRSFREMMSSAVRNHSAERSGARDIGSGKLRDHERDHRGQPSSFREASGSAAFFNNIKNSKPVGMITNRLFGGSSRGENQAPREPVIDDENYVLKVINLPLVEQTRLTRISKRLEDSRDKTEFWMPAFPWRAIDYLNYKGSDVEGLYRVPGSGPQIKKWQRKFDEELDVDLFEQPDLYDINIIGSMLKAWLRELPDELFPKEAQDRIARECAGAETVPQLLIEELSNLSPFNYYLLFAITCHLSLLLAHSDKNKMDFRNLCICFQPCMKIDAFCFKFLVCDWRECWKGCKNEAKYIEEEYARFDQPPPLRAVTEARKHGNGLKTGAGTGNGNGNGNTTTNTNVNINVTPPPTMANVMPKVEERQEQQRAVSSSNSTSSNTGSNQSASEQKQQRLKKKTVQETQPIVDSGSPIATTTLTINSETPPRKSGDLRPLSPIKPLSPLNF
ncbi:hypothetical protein QBC38DRAFT_127977 [Podospora fimiseda]|uniref:Rho-GAP domain-containing protein n=1 Tax=Podospora fimiseda TaxID=252190 RepID=A0AAN7BT71_9PEZI|nr:hypothetical protein QBC38DRAFT_127977 [Podospora fimiseda]